MERHKIHQKIDSEHQRTLDELFDLLCFPTISAQPEHAIDLVRTAEWLQQYCEKIGFKTTLLQTKNAPPVVCAEFCSSPEKPTLLIYGHYDVQPIDPIEEWLTPPFSPVIQDGMIYARGVSDDKGQFFSVLKAAEAIISFRGSLPLNIKIVIEGEEEIVSAHFEELLTSHTDIFQADLILIMDAGQYTRGIPALTYGLRGLCYFQIDIQGPAYDVHSGQYGGGVPNPIQALMTILNRLKTDDGKITIPGFYDTVLEPEPWERQEMATLPFEREQIKNSLGIKTVQNEKGYTPLESMTVRPTLDVCGIWGGYSGPGSKTIIPARCGAKVSMRLVPNQSPGEIASLFKQYIETIAPQEVDIHIQVLPGIEPLLTNPHQPLFQAFSRAISQNFDRPPVLIRGGGSVGVANLLKRILKTEAICMTGWGCPDDGIHSPNEHFSVNDFFRGIHAFIDFLLEYARIFDTR